ncbi:thromboxane-A synthase-like isoform X2 [Rhincodon typus]|uniref:thromboxane-A synthase-like isoform X2 n=1 Tax=Rhincodon typus TaxID=259920 RepID=UPI00202DBDBF|nr:thromboxane-A synthase-like isoform X2 [Rhincodon typus]
MDVIASVAFGTQIDSQRNPDDPFVKHAKMVFNVNFFKPLIFLNIIFPFIMMPFRLVMPHTSMTKANAFFIKVIKDIIAQRDRQPTDQKRRDFLQLMLDARISTDYTTMEKFDVTNSSGEIEESPETQNAKDMAKSSPARIQKKVLSLNKIFGQAFIFFAAGYETTSSTLSFVSYLLATHPESQELLLKEVDEFYESHIIPDYNNVQNLTYLDMVISESLRMYPPGVRFTPELKAERHPFVYLPFGAGPRSCIAMRLALLEAKIVLVRILSKYSFQTCPETQVPLRIKSLGSLGPKEGVILKIVPRKC